ncbi:amino acid ABC transporter permease [Vibrio sp. vnigr-6D03]|uniref:amino acid ABC transporter permease n=1 Tax=Vibrio sp. vnigr-6D03 TaxID=2058088 RepID=UPI000C322AFE|nr:amino acid ABC transporter permease [Vibrio sp. vnigr-6D03]PKF79669.1 amino acid ABC transporter permease [Vibrio sp. vnigr-6D03]
MTTVIERSIVNSEPIEFIPQPPMTPPVQVTGIVHWIHKNLFDGWYNSLLTLLSITLLMWVLPPFISWAFIDSVWQGSAQECRVEGAGACWAFVAANFRILMVGIYPPEEVWRPALSLLLLFGVIGLTIAQKVKGLRMVSLWLVLPFIAYWLIGGGSLGLPEVDQSRWGGLMLSLLLACVGIIISVPLGILLALGRFSDVPLLRIWCVTSIEMIRGVPLITILFMASVMLPLFLPEGMDINNLLRIQVGIILFSSAYIAEVIRGGLQAIPNGQFDAAKALGLNYRWTMFYIVIPQALRHVLPPLIGRCIALFKDTSLVLIVGLLDLLGMLKSTTQDADWLGFEAESYVFGAFVYWVICYSMSRYGKHLEEQGAKSHH